MDRLYIDKVLGRCPLIPHPVVQFPTSLAENQVGQSFLTTVCKVSWKGFLQDTDSFPVDGFLMSEGSLDRIWLGVGEVWSMECTTRKLGGCLVRILVLGKVQYIKYWTPKSRMR